MINALRKPRPHRIQRRKQCAFPAQHLVQTFNHAPVRPGFVCDFKEALKSLVLPSGSQQNRYRPIRKRGGTANPGMAVDEKPGLFTIKMARDQIQHWPQRLRKMPRGVLALLIMKQESMMRAACDHGMRGFWQIRIKQRHHKPRAPLRSNSSGARGQVTLTSSETGLLECFKRLAPAMRGRRAMCYN
jgi:hypothetical protein